MRNPRPVNRGTSKPAEDIPIAQRDRFVPDASRTTMTGLRRQKRALERWVLIALALAVFTSTVAIGSIFVKNRPSNNIAAVPAASPLSTASESKADTLLGHFRYEEAPSDQLVSIGGGFRLRRSAAEKFKAMESAARSAGINIVTISAFRSVAEQKHLFFDIKAQRAQVTTKRAEVSAPPNYSEHHTGYAIDLGDAAAPAATLNQSFENTAAFKWLQANAPRYSFELSFPPHNAQGVSYEPWHWRYVGDSESLETFYRAKKAQS